MKSPWLCDLLLRTLQDGNVVIDHAIVPVCDFIAAANSRARISAIAEGKPANGGLWNADDPAEQVAVLFGKFSKLMETLVRYDIPVRLMWFPRLTWDAAYTFNKLEFLIPGISFSEFAAAHSQIAKPERVHILSEADA